MSYFGYRVRSFLAGAFWVLALLCLAGAAVSGYALYSEYTETAERTVVTGSYTTEAGYEYTVPVTEENPVWPVGTELGDRPTYFFSVSPNLKGGFTYGVEATRADLSVDADAKLVLQQRSSGGEVYWSVERSLGDESGEVTPGEPLELPFTVAVKSVRQEIASISDELDVGRGQRKAKVVTTVTYSGEIEGEQVEGTETYEMPIGMERNGFAVESNLSWEEVTRMEEKRTVDDPPSMKERAILTSTLSLSLLFLVGLALVRFRHEPLGDRELRELRTASERENNAEWISEGSLPDVDATRIRMESLQDLVDAAIDQNRRVVHDGEEGIYFFLADGVLYTYRE